MDQLDGLNDPGSPGAAEEASGGRKKREKKREKSRENATFFRIPNLISFYS